MNINKNKIIEELKRRVQEDLDKSKTAYKSSHEYVTGQELKSEGKYDTRGIEAGYLAGAQKKRVDELELELGLLDEISIDHPSDNVSVGSVVKLKTNNTERFYFVSSTSGGAALNIDGQGILVISAFSPIGTEVIGLERGDSFEIETKGSQRLYEIIDVL